MGEPKGFIVVPIGFNPSDDLRSLELDADDNLKVVFAAAAQGLVGLHGWINGAWYKQPIVSGFSDTYGEAIASTTLPAGTSNVNSVAVPAGEFHRITAFTVWVVSATITEVRLGVFVKGVSVPFFQKLAPVSGQFYMGLCDLWLAPTEILFITVIGATLNDDAFARIGGVRIDTDQ